MTRTEELLAEILKELQTANELMKKTSDDTNYQLRRIATRMEEVSSSLNK